MIRVEYGGLRVLDLDALRSNLFEYKKDFWRNKYGRKML